MAQSRRYVLASSTDKVEADRLDLQHRMWLVQHGGLYSAPLRGIRQDFRVVDVGCGPGTWAIEFASAHPIAKVLGIDIVLPKTESMPLNCSFTKVDAENDWPFENNSLDYVHARMLLLSIQNWPRFWQRTLQHLKPGGWVESNDVAHRFFAEDGSGELDSPMLRWWRLVFQAISRRNGVDLDASYKHAEEMRDAGLVDVRERVFNWPVGGASARAGKDHAIGALMYQNIMDLVGSVTTTAIQHGNLSAMTTEEVRDLAEQAKDDVRNNADQRGFHMHFVTTIGQAPA